MKALSLVLEKKIIYCIRNSYTYGGKRAKKNIVGVKLGKVKCSFPSSFTACSEGNSRPLIEKHECICINYYLIIELIFVRINLHSIIIQIICHLYLQINDRSHTDPDQNQETEYKINRCYLV